MRLTKQQAELTTRDARALGIKRRISTFTTDMGVSSSNRIHNVLLMGKYLEEAALTGSRPDRPVERKRLTRADDGAVEVLAHEQDVVDPVRGRDAHVGREGRDPALDPERPGVPRRQLGLLLRQRHGRNPSPVRREAGGEDGSCTLGRGQSRTAPGPNHANVVPVDGEGRVQGLPRLRGDESAGRSADGVRRENEVVAALGRLEVDQTRERPRPEPSDLIAAEADR